MEAFNYCDMKFTVSDDVANYAEEWKMNIKLQRKKMNEFTRIYQGYGSMDIAIKRVSDDLWSLFSSAITKYANYWIKEGFYDVSPDSFFREYYLPRCQNQELQIQAAYDELEEKYSNIVLSQEQQEEYRRLRKANRGRWQGGGFGVGGALKGAATAGAMNMVTGIGHGVVNTIGNIGTSIATSGKKRKLYEDPSTLSTLNSALASDIFQVLEAHIKFATSHTSWTYKVRYMKDCDKAETILRNIGKLDLPDDEYKKAIHQVFALDPYNPELYKQLLLRYGDAKHELEHMADFFGCLDTLNQYKDGILQKLRTSQKPKTYQDYKQLLDEMTEPVKLYGIDETNSPVLKETQETYKRLELEARTFEGVIYDSPELAQQAKEEKAALDQIVSSIDFSSETSLSEGLTQIEHYNATIWDKTPYITQLRDALNALIEAREKQQLEKIMASVNRMDKDSLIAARQKLEKTNFSTISAAEPLQNLNTEIENFDINIRTVNGKVYETLEDADEARKEVKFCENLIHGIDQNEEDSILTVWNQLNEKHFTYIDSQNYCDTVQQIYHKYKENYVTIMQNKCLAKQDELLKEKDFKGAIQCINNYNLKDADQKMLFECLNEKAKALLGPELSQAEKYKNDRSGFGTILLGAVFFIVIGFFVSKIFSPALLISVILAICGIIGYFMEGKEREAQKKSYEFICKLESIGYSFGISDSKADS